MANKTFGGRIRPGSNFYRLKSFEIRSIHKFV